MPRMSVRPYRNRTYFDPAGHVGIVRSRVFVWRKVRRTLSEESGAQPNKRNATYTKRAAQISVIGFEIISLPERGV